MEGANEFGWWWASAIIVGIALSTAWGLNDLRLGKARFNMFGLGERVSREDEPFEFWMAVGSKLIVLPVGAFALWRGWAFWF